MIVYPVVALISSKSDHLTSLNPRMLSLYLLISFMTILFYYTLFPMVYIVLTFQHPMFKWSLGVRRDLLRGRFVLLASFRLSPGAVIVASPQWRKLLSGGRRSQVALFRSRRAFGTEVVSVASWFLWERVAGPLPNLILQIRKLPNCFCQDFRSRPLRHG